MAQQINQVNMTFTSYPGYINPSEKSIYEFPEVHYLTRNGRKRIWQIIIQLCAGNAIVAESINNSSDPSNVKPVPIKAEYFDRNPGDIYGRIIVIQRQVNTQIGAATLVTSGKHLGHINETSIFRQSLIVAFTKYADHVLSNHQFCPDSPHLKDTTNNDLSRIKNQQNGYIPPMLPCVSDPEEWWNEHKGLVLSQLKLNGTRCLASRFGSIDLPLKIYTRGARNYPRNNFWGDLELLTATYPNLIFDGEAYRHDLSLQEISGSMRNQGKGGKTQEILFFYIYDCFDPSNMAQAYGDRYEKYMSISNTPMAKALTYIKFLPAIKFDTFAEVRSYFDNAINVDKYEGLVLKDTRGPYEPSFNNYRSSWSCKYKGVISTEFTLIGWKEGEGKAAGMMAAFECQITQLSIDNLHGQKVDNMLIVGSRFFCNIKATEQIKKQWFQNATEFERQYLGKYVTVEFRDISKLGVPQQAYWIDFADESVVDTYKKTEEVVDF